MNYKCIVKDCENHSNEGGFKGDVCLPCYEFITTGKGKYSQMYRNSNPVKQLNYMLEIIEQFRQEKNPPHKQYETYNDGWLDACNEIYWAIEKISE